ncbi:MAG: hypothetical protein LUD22_01445 [Coprobacillus sp.]|nr:hypothetical protein [Coprobacillus sp.]
MKKGFVLLSALVLLLAGCSEITTDTDTETDSTSSETTESEPEESTPSESTPTDPTDPGEGGLPEGATEMTFKDQNDVVSEAASVMYFWNEQDENHVDIDLAYNLNSTFHIEYSVVEGLNPVWYGIQLFLELSSEDKATYGLTEGDEYTVSLTLKSSVSGKITVNGVEQDISAGDNTISVTSTTRIGATQETWDAGTSSTITLYIPTLLIQLGTENGGFLGAATIEVSNLSFAKTETSDTTEAITATGLSNVNGVEGSTDGKMHYWANSATVNEATHYLNEDKYVIDYSNATGDWWGFQIFWMLDATQLSEYQLSESSMYTLTFKLESSVAGTITVNNDAITISQGSNDISVNDTVNSSSTDHATFHIWMGSNGTSLISAGKVEITDISFAPYEAPTTFTYSYSADFSSMTLATQADGEQDDSVAAPGTLCRWAIEYNWGATAGGITSISDSISDGKYTCTVTIPAGELSYAYQLFYTAPSDANLSTGTSYTVRVTLTVSTAVRLRVNETYFDLEAGTSTISTLSNHTKNTSNSDVAIIIGGDNLSSALTLTLTLSEITLLWN